MGQCDDFYTRIQELQAKKRRLDDLQRYAFSWRIASQIQTGSLPTKIRGPARRLQSILTTCGVK